MAEAVLDIQKWGNNAGGSPSGCGERERPICMSN